MGLSQERIRKIILDIVCKTRFISRRQKIINANNSADIINLNILDEVDEWYRTKNYKI